MADLKGMRVVVAGAGAVGCVTALTLQRLGARVVLADSAPVGANASGVAAGMLAPVGETLLDEADAGRMALYRAARDAWEELLSPYGAPLHRCGAIFIPEDGDADGLAARIGALGASAQVLAPVEAAHRSAGLDVRAPVVFTPEDWRLDPLFMLAALPQFLQREKGTLARGQVVSTEKLGADAVVLATGFAPQGWDGDLGPSVRSLTPIKGQIARFAGAGPKEGPIVRGGGVYVVPTLAGPFVGSTMEEGRDDTEVEPEVIEDFHNRVARLYPGLGLATAAGAAGVRAASPDGLPLAGASAQEGVWLALGARRNGWLLAPLIAQTLARRLSGEAPQAWDGLFDPARFG